MIDVDVMTLNTSLNWLQSVTGMDEGDLEKWELEAWNEWAKAMTADPEDVNPSVPEWMQPLLNHRWGNDFSLPFPSVAQLWPTGHDWLREAERREDFTLEVEVPGSTPEDAPTLTQLRRAWDTTTSYGATPLLDMLIVPAQPWGQAVHGLIDAFRVSYSGTLDGVLVSEPAEILGATGTSGPGVHDPEHDMHSWEWM